MDCLDRVSALRSRLFHFNQVQPERVWHGARSTMPSSLVAIISYFKPIPFLVFLIL
jgi:hypothetical protein